MKRELKNLTIWVVVLAVGLVGGAVSGDSVSVVAVAPEVLYAATPTAVSVTAVSMADHGPVTAPVAVLFGPDASSLSLVFAGATDDHGRITARFNVPNVERGVYTLEIEVGGLDEALTAQVQVDEKPVLLIETDKPIYKPGQTIHGRVLVLTRDLVPSTSQASIEITDGKGVKIFRQGLETNAFGVALFELDLATELNFGTWKITAESGSGSCVVDVRVEKYVLPRFDAELLTERDYFLVDEPIIGTINANYFFGKAVDGDVEVHASRYIGVWEEYASYSTT